jgi:hypothetical protein
MIEKTRPPFERWIKSRSDPPARVRAGAWVLLVLALGLLWPTPALAHGPVDPAASRYEARIFGLPAGLTAQVIDGDQRMWLRVAPSRSVVVLDYRGAPYLRYSRAGVEVNQRSAMYFLNQVPAQIPPAGVGPNAPPRWSSAGSGHTYSWHDGRLHALATVALAPGSTYAGRWTIPLRVGGSPAAISGGLFVAPDPSIVWFWPIVVVLASVLAAVRLGRRELDLRLARGLALCALIAFVVVGAGQQLHGRPTVSAGQLVVLALIAAFAGWGLRRLVLARHGWFVFFLIAVAAIWQGASSIAVLLDGFVLLALPSVVARVAVVTCLAAGIGLVAVVFRMAERPARAVRAEGGDDELKDEDDLDFDDEHAWELGR